MKVISGSLKGRNIKGYDILGTRPTMDRVKESIFGMIQEMIPNSVFLDLFAGSGNIGIEAISNGALRVYFNDYNKKCLHVIKNNLQEFNCLEKGILTNLDYKEILNYYKNNNIKFNIVFLDPPYKEKIMEEIMDILINKDLLQEKGIVICEATYNVNYNNLKLIKEKKYGEKKVFIYQK